MILPLLSDMMDSLPYLSQKGTIIAITETLQHAPAYLQAETLPDSVYRLDLVRRLGRYGMTDVHLRECSPDQWESVLHGLLARDDPETHKETLGLPPRSADSQLAVAEGLTNPESHFMNLERRYLEEVKVEIAAMDPAKAEAARETLAAIQQAPHDEELRPHGLDFSDAWLVDIADQMTAGRPLRYRAVRVHADSSPIVAGKQPPVIANQRIGQLLTSLTFEGAQGFHNIAVDDALDRSTGQPIGAPMRDKLKPRIDQVLKEAGVVRLGDWMGEDYNLRSAGDARWKTLQKLQHFVSPPLTYEQDHPQDTSPVMQELLQNTDGSLNRLGLLLVDFVDQFAESYLTLSVADEQERTDYEAARTLISSRFATCHQNFRTLFIDSTKVSPAMAAYAVAHRLHRAIERVAYAMHNYAMAPHMSLPIARDYLLEEYGSRVKEPTEFGILPGDQAVIEKFLELMPLLFPRGVGDVIAPAWGQYSYLAQLLAPHLRPGARIKASDIAVANITLGMNLRDDVVAYRNETGDLVADEEVMGVGPKFEHLLVAKGGEQYEGSYAALRKALDISHGDMYKLGEGPRADVVLDSFGSYAICWSKRQFWELTHQKATALNTGGIAVTTALTRSKEWRGFPAVYLTEQDIIQANEDAGLSVLGIYPMSSHAKTREGYDSMVLVIARKDPPFVGSTDSPHGMAHGNSPGDRMLRNFFYRGVRSDYQG